MKYETTVSAAQSTWQKSGAGGRQERPQDAPVQEAREEATNEHLALKCTLRHFLWMLMCFTTALTSNLPNETFGMLSFHGAPRCLHLHSSDPVQESNLDILRDMETYDRLYCSKFPRGFLADMAYATTVYYGQFMWGIRMSNSNSITSWDGP